MFLLTLFLFIFSCDNKQKASKHKNINNNQTSREDEYVKNDSFLFTTMNTNDDTEIYVLPEYHSNWNDFLNSEEELKFRSTEIIRYGDLYEIGEKKGQWYRIKDYKNRWIYAKDVFFVSSNDISKIYSNPFVEKLGSCQNKIKISSLNEFLNGIDGYEFLLMNRCINIDETNRNQESIVFFDAKGRLIKKLKVKTGTSFPNPRFNTSSIKFYKDHGYQATNYFVEYISTRHFEEGRKIIIKSQSYNAPRVSKQARKSMGNDMALGLSGIYSNFTITLLDNNAKVLNSYADIGICLCWDINKHNSILISYIPIEEFQIMLANHDFPEFEEGSRLKIIFSNKSSQVLPAEFPSIQQARLFEDNSAVFLDANDRIYLYDIHKKKMSVFDTHNNRNLYKVEMGKNGKILFKSEKSIHVYGVDDMLNYQQDWYE